MEILRINTDNNSENTDADSGDSEDFVDRYELYERYKDFDVDKYVDDLPGGDMEVSRTSTIP